VNGVVAASMMASPLDFVVGFPLLILGIWWCLIDAAERDYRFAA